MRTKAAWCAAVLLAMATGAVSSAWGQCNENDATHEYFNGVYTAPDLAVYGGPEYQYSEPCINCEVAPGWTPWRDSWGNDGDFYQGPYVPAPEPDPGIDCEAQELVIFAGSFGAVKQFQLEEGQSYRVHIWIKTGNGADTGPSSPGNWVEFGFSKNGQTNNNGAAVAWDIQPKQAGQLAAWGVWHEYVHIDELVMDQGDTASLWLKVGAAFDPAGITACFDYLWFEETGDPQPTCYALPDTFDGPYSSGIMDGWKPRNLPGGTTQFREEAPGVTGSAQRLASQDSIFGVAKLFTVPTNEAFALQVSVKTASLLGDEPATPGAILGFGYDLTGNNLDPTAGTIVWNNTLNGDPEGGFDTWLDYQLGPITSDNDCIAVWLWCDASGQFQTQGVRVDFDDLQIVGAEPPVPQPEFTAIERTAADEVTVTWSAVSGQTYRVWLTGDLVTPSWSNVMDVLATGDTASYIDSVMGVGTRFYDVELLP